jgi:hypothetical protein
VTGWALRNQNSDHSFTQVPSGAGKIVQVGAGIDVDALQVLALHQIASTVESVLEFLYSDIDRIRCHIQELSELRFRY